MEEKKIRSFLKSLSWRITATLITILLIWVITQELILSLQVGIVEMLIKLMIYYFHERIWNRIRWGMK